jgi:predicted nucleic acid-binding protein
MKLSEPTATVAAGNMYLDTGILVKLLTPEPETVWFERGLRGHSMATSELALVEIKSALFAKERAKLISREQRLRAEAKLSELISQEILEFKNLNNRVLKKATQIIEACHPNVPLRALDALHVASCDLAQEFPLCTTDARMHAAARAMHIPVFPENLPLTI